ncbi:MAG: hypothetical protein AAF908_00710 [Pseudomonadota bacterium]
MRAPLLLLLVLSLAACAQERLVTLPKAPTPPPVGPEIVVSLGVSGQPAWTLVEQVGSRCWLDTVLGASEMLVERNSGRVQLNGDGGVLLAGDFLASEGPRGRLRLSGPVITDPVKRDQLVASLDRAVRTGETAC